MYILYVSLKSTFLGKWNLKWTSTYKWSSIPFLDFFDWWMCCSFRSFTIVFFVYVFLKVTFKWSWIRTTTFELFCLFNNSSIWFDFVMFYVDMLHNWTIWIVRYHVSTTTFKNFFIIFNIFLRVILFILDIFIGFFQIWQFSIFLRYWPPHLFWQNVWSSL